MKNLADEILLDVYRKAVELNLDKDFICIIKKEVKRRGLPLVTWTDHTNYSTDS
ncbi:sporulation histidine kinase inhibitor Sda [Bacillus sp. V2I10]|uniref:sporulation histidine kinase inhibitor Sda n=1 Tax=Bacillus sp. V2I10 TaxID=3042276 RepID=UPI002784DE91|nr:sporulation histidine kinase inhibitor Sda [Bacillus sp. V2I10]MDQ0859088.1 developmental checkpoint coupling sporulation initiation to replication initiation [Bacillus sp. V2I10]